VKQLRVIGAYFGNQIVPPVLAALFVAAIYAAWRAWKPDQGPPVSEVGWGVAIFVAALVGVHQVQMVWAEGRVLRRYLRRLEQLEGEVGDWFLARQRGAPPMMPLDVNEFAAHRNRWYQYSQETIQEYRRRFDGRVVALIRQLQDAGFEQEELQRTSRIEIINELQIQEVLRGLSVAVATLKENW